MSGRQTRLSRRHSTLPSVNSSRFGLDGAPSQAEDSLPVYSRRHSLRPQTSQAEQPPRSQTVHTYTLSSRNNRSWLTLNISSWVENAASVPVFVEAESIAGHIHLDLEKPDSIKALIVTVKGLARSGVDIKPFYQMSQILWEKSMGNPRISSPSQDKFRDKLEGKYSWPFSVTLPSSVTFTEKQMKEFQVSGEERLPPSLKASGGFSFIDYQLVVDVKRSGAFRPGSSLSTPIGYLPRTKPPRPSAQRRQAYSQGVAIPGPRTDPDGWHVLYDVSFKGELFKTRSVIVKAKLSLALPLVYTRGTVIPLYLIMKSLDKQAIDLLSNACAPRVQMRRKMKGPTALARDGTSRTLPGSENNVEASRVSWAAAHESEQMDTDGYFRRTLIGEVLLPSNLTPSFTFGEFDLKYFVDMYPFCAPGFEPSDDNRLSRTEVTITAGFPDGPRPRAYLPPGYAQEHRRDSDDDNVGVLYNTLDRDYRR